MAYVCKQCGFKSDEPGECPQCKVALEEEKEIPAEPEAEEQAE